MPSAVVSDYPVNLQQRLLALLDEERRPLAIRIDHGMVVEQVFGDAPWYGLRLTPGDPLREALPVLFGYEATAPAALSLVHLTSGRVADVHILPDGEHAYVLLLDSSQYAEQTHGPQQRANEAALLNYRQSQLMEALGQAKRDAEAASRLKSDFIANFSHEFRTPLTSIMGYCRLLEQSGEYDVRHSAAIQRAAGHLLSLVENLLEHGRVEHDRIELLDDVVSLQEVFDDIETLLAPMAAQQGLTVTVRGDENAVRVLGDPVRLRQIITNLAMNALKYTREGSVDIRWRYRPGLLRVRVRDTGPGIPDDQRERIFQPFAQGEHTDRRGGLGLGLALSRHLAEAMGGELRLTESGPQGSTFVFTAPLRPALEETETGTLEFAPASGEARRLLIAEDDADVATLLELVLGDNGFDCEAVDSLQALQQIAAHDFDAILLDMHFTDASGVEMLQHLARQAPGVPVLAMSASTAEATRRAALRAGARALIVKPFDFPHLIKHLRAL